MGIPLQQQVSPTKTKRLCGGSSTHSTNLHFSWFWGCQWSWNRRIHPLGSIFPQHLADVWGYLRLPPIQGLKPTDTNWRNWHWELKISRLHPPPFRPWGWQFLVAKLLMSSISSIPHPPMKTYINSCLVVGVRGEKKWFAFTWKNACMGGLVPPYCHGCEKLYPSDATLKCSFIFNKGFFTNQCSHSIQDFLSHTFLWGFVWCTLRRRTTLKNGQWYQGIILRWVKHDHLVDFPAR